MGVGDRLGAGDRLAACGQMEVLVAARAHNEGLADLSPAAAGELVTLARDRFNALAARRGARSVRVFQNHGARAGASISVAERRARVNGGQCSPSTVRRSVEAFTTSTLHVRAAGMSITISAVVNALHRVLAAHVVVLRAVDGGHLEAWDVPLRLESDRLVNGGEALAVACHGARAGGEAQIRARLFFRRVGSSRGIRAHHTTPNKTRPAQTAAIPPVQRAARRRW